MGTELVISHELADFFVVDETGLPFGRPYITTCFDRSSRRALSTRFSFASSYEDALACLEEFIKVPILSSATPEMQGATKPPTSDTVTVDDASPEFRSEHFTQACAALGFKVRYLPRCAPCSKGSVEHCMRRLAQRINQLENELNRRVLADQASTQTKRVVSLQLLKEALRFAIASDRGSRKAPAAGYPTN